MTSNGVFNMKYLQIFASLLLYIVWVLFNMLYNAVIRNKQNSICLVLALTYFNNT